MYNPADRGLANPPTAADVEVGAVLSPVLQGHQNPIFESQLGFRSWFWGWPPPAFERLDQGLKGVAVNPKATLEVFGRQGWRYRIVHHQDVNQLVYLDVFSLHACLA